MINSIEPFHFKKKHPMRQIIFVLVLFPILALAAEGEKHALLIGVQEYTGTGLGNLKYCEEDVHALADTLPSLGYDKENIIVLSRRSSKERDKDVFRPTAANVRKWLKSVCEDARGNDTVLLAFAGHGVQLKNDGKMYFCPLDSDLNKRETLISLDELYEKMDKDCKASVKLLLVDACRNDPLDGGRGNDERIQSVTLPQIPDPPGGMAAFFSCSKGQRAFESDTLKHGVFFYHLIEGLKGKAGNDEGEVTVPILEDYLTRLVPRTVKREMANPDLSQIPERRGTLRGSVVLAKVKPGTAIANAVIAQGITENGNEFSLDLGNNTKLELVKVPAGTFEMGSPPDEKERGDNEKQHRVTISKAFYMGKYHVTVGQFREFVRAENYKTDAERGTPDYQNGKKGAYIYQNGKTEFSESGSWMNPGFQQKEDEPVVCVCWNDARKYVEWLAKKSGKKVRLPTEAEWEYVCRAGTKTPFNTGETISTAQANYDGNFTYGDVAKGVYREKTTRVGSFKANAFGLYDMHGNAWQWCQDLYRKDYENLSVTDPENKTEGMERVLRGGSLLEYPKNCRSANRNNTSPDLRGYDVGFRVVVSLD